MKKRHRWLASSLVVIVGACAAFGWCEYRNNTEAVPPTAAEVHASFDAATAWIMQRRSQVLSENNAMLWLFVRQASRLAANEPLAALATRFENESARGTVNQFLFEPAIDARTRDLPIQLDDSWAAYQRLFIYGSTCNTGLSFDPQVQSELSPEACASRRGWLHDPWCRTHQLMGLRFVQRNHCEPDEQVARTIAATQAGILAELSWDFRVEDAYLQKVWTLIESGRRDAIKPVWIRRILAAQRADGGWSGQDEILRLPGDRALFWTGGSYPRIGPVPQSDFHATAQGLYLMALLGTSAVHATK
jgi:hypothetical protein